jgi:hypothetical protein
VPFAQVVGVVAFIGVARGRAEVAKVARRTRRVVVVAARCRVRPRLVAAPAGVVAVLVLGGGSGVVGVVAGGEDRAGDAVEQLGGLLVARIVALGYVPRPDQYRVVIFLISALDCPRGQRVGRRGCCDAGQVVAEE